MVELKFSKANLDAAHGPRVGGRRQIARDSIHAGPEIVRVFAAVVWSSYGRRHSLENDFVVELPSLQPVLGSLLRLALFNVSGHGNRSVHRQIVAIIALDDQNPGYQPVADGPLRGPLPLASEKEAGLVGKEELELSVRNLRRA